MNKILNKRRKQKELQQLIKAPNRIVSHQFKPIVNKVVSELNTEKLKLKTVVLFEHITSNINSLSKRLSHVLLCPFLGKQLINTKS